MWALNLLVLMIADPDREWTVALLINELRASNYLVAGLLNLFRQQGLASEVKPGLWKWQAKDGEIAAMARRVADAYAVTPMAVLHAIADTPNDRLRQFAEAFRLRRD